MPMWFWYVIAAWLGILAIGTGYLIYRDARRQGQIAEARAVLEAAADNPESTVRRLSTFDALRADVTASDYGYRAEGEAWDEHVTAAIDLASATPIHDELAVEHLRRDLDQWGREGA